MKEKKKYYQPLFYDGAYEGKKRGRKSKEEKEEWIKEQQLKIIRKITILTFD
jgi:hypothetical protein